MRDIPELVEGYRRFLDERYPQEAELYSKLADKGQSPKTMIVACCDSRADPATIFNAHPGQFFVVRNVANLVPPFEPEGDYHGTSAALEFAVTALEVENILVMGHARCGGVRACLEGLHEEPEKSAFIGKWISLLKPAREETLGKGAGSPAEKLQEALEHAGIRQSIENLGSFPFIKERVESGRLRLRGAYFDIANGKLQSLDPQSGRFEALT